DQLAEAKVCPLHCRAGFAIPFYLEQQVGRVYESPICEECRGSRLLTAGPARTELHRDFRSLLTACRAPTSPPCRQFTANQAICSSEHLASRSVSPSATFAVPIPIPSPGS